MIILSLFDGISIGRVAAQHAGLDVTKYYASEIDTHTIEVTKRHWPDTIQLGSVENWKSWAIDWASIDMLIGGSPCQGFSLLGNQLNFDDPRSKLFFIYLDILNHIKKLNPNVKFFLENVRMKKEWVANISEWLGVEPLFTNSDLVSAGSRPRYYWANWNITPPKDRGITYKNIIMEDGLLPATVRKGDPRPIVLTGDKFLCLTATYHKGIRGDGRPALARYEGEFNVLRERGDCRPLTPAECELLMTIPYNYTLGISNTQRYKMLGNSWTMEMIAHFFKQLKESML